MECIKTSNRVWFDQLPPVSDPRIISQNDPSTVYEYEDYEGDLYIGFLMQKMEYKFLKLGYFLTLLFISVFCNYVAV